MSLGDVDKDVAVFNTKRLYDTLCLLMERFESSKHFHPTWAMCKWVNHPDRNYVTDGCFEDLCEQHFSDINMHFFLTELKYNDYFEAFRAFAINCVTHYYEISYVTVECAHEKMLELLNSLEELS